MLSINKIKFLRSLKLKKYRHQYRTFLVEGEKLAQEMLIRPQANIQNIYALPSWIEANERLFAPWKSKTILVSEKELKKVSSFKTPNKVIVEASFPNLSFEKCMDARISCMDTRNNNKRPTPLNDQQTFLDRDR